MKMACMLSQLIALNQWLTLSKWINAGTVNAIPSSSYRGKGNTFSHTGVGLEWFLENQGLYVGSS